MLTQYYHQEGWCCQAFCKHSLHYLGDIEKGKKRFVYFLISGSQLSCLDVLYIICLCVCERACVRACVRCVCVCVCAWDLWANVALVHILFGLLRFTPTSHFTTVKSLSTILCIQWWCNGSLETSSTGRKQASPQLSLDCLSVPHLCGNSHWKS